mmetsp:Transcript_6701/g.9624  ORF Transcript_6701/g.9624 Transcript_6701/m.9624 type:complete len:117 (-) Transcript_6701:143-493(-)
MLARINYGFRMWMPTMPMTLVSARNATERNPARATFRVLPRMTKHEIKEYLTKIYDLPVKKVNTINYLGKRKRAMGKRRIIHYKYKDFKKAIVTFDSSLQDLGIGMRIPEMEERSS